MLGISCVGDTVNHVSISIGIPKQVPKSIYTLELTIIKLAKHKFNYLLAISKMQNLDWDKILCWFIRCTTLKKTLSKFK